MSHESPTPGHSRCPVCDGPLGEPLYRSAERFSITSLCQVLPGQTLVYFCDRCGHLATPPLPDLEKFYDQEYTILIDSEDEDQLYEVRDGRQVYRYDHQVDTLLRKLDLPAGAKVLEYGAAKGATLRRLAARRPDLQAHLFDVSDMYRPFWARFCPADRCATYKLPGAWQGHFDAVLAFFVLEHVADPRDMIAVNASLLRPGGQLYLIVPNAYGNVVDFVVADHVNHFSAPSLRALLGAGGLADIEVDDKAHRAAFVVRATKGPGAVPASGAGAVGELRAQAQQMARHWREYGERVRALEASHPAEAPVAIYGSGVYSTFLTSSLRHPERVRCYIDRNPHRQGKRHLDRDVVAPAALPGDVQHAYVALNPLVARREMEHVPGWEGRQVHLLYP